MDTKNLNQLTNNAKLMLLPLRQQLLLDSASKRLLTPVAADTSDNSTSSSASGEMAKSIEWPQANRFFIFLNLHIEFHVQIAIRCNML